MGAGGGGGVSRYSQAGLKLAMPLHQPPIETNIPVGNKKTLSFLWAQDSSAVLWSVAI
jgi:hypothetical protein